MPNLKQQLQEVQDDQRSKSLDLREAALEKREQLLDDSARIANIELLDKQIVIKTDIKSNIEGEIVVLEKQYKIENDRVTVDLESLQSSLIKNQNAFNASVTKKEHIEELIVLARRDLQLVKSEISEQKRNVKSEEQQVQDTMADWNAQLTSLQGEADIIAESKKKLSADIVRLDQEKDDKLTEAEQLTEKIRQLDVVYRTRMDAIKEELSLANENLEAKKQEERELAIKLKTRLEVVASREKSLSVKEMAFKGKEAELNQRAQRIGMLENDMAEV